MLEFIKIMLGGEQAKAEERGATAVEYGLMVALIAILIIGAVLAMSGKLKDMFIQVAGNL